MGSFNYCLCNLWPPLVPTRSKLCAGPGEFTGSKWTAHKPSCAHISIPCTPCCWEMHGCNSTQSPFQDCRLYFFQNLFKTKRESVLQLRLSLLIYHSAHLCVCRPDIVLLLIDKAPVGVCPPGYQWHHSSEKQRLPLIDSFGECIKSSCSAWFIETRQHPKGTG